jgi:hypothetical protein
MMAESESHGPHLRTKYVFIDTQAFRRARFDWDGRALSKLADFAKQRRLRLLVTDVVVREVKSQLLEVLTEANASLSKHGGILEQLGASIAIERNQGVALKMLEATFDKFLQRANSINVPLTSDIKSLLDDYFDRRPPFSNKKKAEFPDAISIASVRLWCQQKKATAYIVSGDPDLRACCSETGPLFHVASIADLITQATVSQELHDALEKALGASEYLNEKLAEEIKEIEVEAGRTYLSPRRRITAAKVHDVNSIKITSLNVLDQQEQVFTCEPEIEATVDLNVDVETEGDYFEPPHIFSTSLTSTQYFYPEVIVRFDSKTGEIEFESVVLGSPTIEVDVEEISPRSFR